MSRAARTRVILGFAVIALGAITYRAVFEGRVAAGRDVYRMFIPDAAFLRECLLNGEWPLWNPYLRLGQPFAATLQSQAFYPPRILATLVAGPIWALTVEHLIHVAIAATGTFLAARRLGASGIASAVAGAAFGLGLMLKHLGDEQNIVAAAAFSGLVLAFAVELGRRGRASSAAGLAVCLGLSLLAGSPETTLWQAILGLVAAIFAAPRSRVRAGALAIAASAWGGLIAAMALLPAAELARESERAAGGADRLVWSNSPLDLVSMFWPGANFPPSAYWEDQTLVSSLFQGTLVMACAACALLSRGGRRRALPAAVAGAALAVVSLGRYFPPSAWLLEVPPFSLFRYPAKYAVGTGFVACVLCAVGIDRLAALACRVSQRRRAAWMAVALAVALAPAGVFVARAARMREAAGPGLAWAVLFLGLAGATFFAVPGGGVRRGRRLRGAIAAAIALELGAAHLLGGVRAYADARRLGQPSRIGEAIDRREWSRVSIDRALITERFAYATLEETLLEAGRYIAASRDMLVPNRFVEEHIHAAEGYGPLGPRRAMELAEEGWRGFFDLAGVAWYVRRGPAPFPDLSAVEVPSKAGDPAPGMPRLYRSRTAMPRAFVVHRAVVASDEAAVEALADPSSPFRHTAFLSVAPGDLPSTDACDGSSASVVRASANALELDVDACGAGVLVIADAFFPGWLARLDGREAPLWRADYALRAVSVPKGRHRVELRYRPASFMTGAGLTALATLALIPAIVSGRFRLRRERRHPILIA